MSTKPGAIITILYKRAPDLKFDTDYFQSVHVPLGTKYWSSRGLMEGYSTVPTEESEFAFMFTMYWKSLEAWQEAHQVAEEVGEIMADVPNFTNGTPTIVVGKVLDGGKKAGLTELYASMRGCLGP